MLCWGREQRAVAGLNTNVNGRVMKGFYPSGQSLPVTVPVTTLAWDGVGDPGQYHCWKYSSRCLTVTVTVAVIQLEIWIKYPGLHSGSGLPSSIEILICLSTVKTKTLQNRLTDCLTSWKSFDKVESASSQHSCGGGGGGAEHVFSFPV